MNTKFLLIILFILFFAACSSKKEHSLPSFQKEKSKQAKDACSEIRFPRDISINGKFMYNFVKCASNKSGEGEDIALETLPSSVRLVNELKVDGLQTIINLLLIEISGQADYPLLKASTVMLERGEGKSEQNVGFQKFLLNTKPYWIVHLLFEMNETKNLKNLLDQLNDFIKSIDINKFFALTKSYLQDTPFKKAFLKTSYAMLENASIYNAIEDMLTLTSSTPMSYEGRVLSFNDWVNPQMAGNVLDEDRLPSTSSNTGLMAGQKPTSAIYKHQDFLKDLGEDGIQKIRNGLSYLINEIITTESSKRLGIIKRLDKGMEEALFEQKSPLKNYVSILNFLRNTKAEEFTNFMSSLKEILDAQGVSTIQALNFKVGSSIFHSWMEDIIFNGGQIEGCTGVTFKGLKELKTDDDYPLWIDTLLTFFKPHASCKHNLSPLATFLFSKISNKLNCPKYLNDPNYHVQINRFCPKEEEFKDLSKNMSADPWVNSVSYQQVDPKLLKELILSTLNEYKSELSKDPYALHWGHMARGAVSKQFIDQLIGEVNKIDTLGPEEVAKLDEQIERDSRFNRCLNKDFFENIINAKIEKLSSTIEQFNNFFTPHEDLRFFRTLLGVYNNGPLEQIVRRQFHLNTLPDELLEDLPKDRLRVKELLSRLRIPGSTFTDYRLDRMIDDSNFTYKFLGEKKTLKVLAKRFNLVNGEYLNSSFTLDRNSFTEVQNIFSKSHNALFRLRKNLSDVAPILLGKDVYDANDGTENQSDHFVTWVEKIINYDKWDWPQIVSKENVDGLDLELIDTTFIEPSEAYSKEEVQKLALFYSINYLQAPNISSEKGKYKVYKLKKEAGEFGIRKRFRSFPTYSKKNWTTFLNFFPNKIDLFNGDLSPLSNISKETFENIYNYDLWKLSLSDQDKIYKLDAANTENAAQDEQLEVIKTLSTLNLLTINRNSRNRENYFMPLIGIGNKEDPGKCWRWLNSKKRESSLCPLSFSSYEDLKKFVNLNFHSYLCPYVNPNEGFTPEFIDFIKENMGIVSDNQELMNFCSNDPGDINLQHDEKNKDNNYLPRKISEHVLTDIIRLGKNPRLKDGLPGVGLKIRYFKLKNKHKNDSSLLARGLMNSRNGLSPFWTSYVSKSMTDHKGLYTFFPGMIDLYMHYLIREIDVKEKPMLNAMSTVASHVYDPYSDDQGRIYHFINKFIIGLHTKAKERDASALDFIVNILEELPDNEEYLDSLIMFLAYPDDLETISIMTQGFPNLLAQMKVRDPNFNWDNKGLNMVKHFLRQEVWKSLADVGIHFSPSELKSGLKIIINGIKKLGNNHQEIISLIEKASNHLDGFLLANYNDKNDNSKWTVDSLEDDILTLFKENLPLDHLESLNLFIDSLGSSHKDFSNLQVPPILTEISPLIDYGLKKGPILLSIYQEASDKLNYNGQYFKNILHSLVDPIEQDEDHEGTKKLISILESPNLGTFKEIYRPIIFENSYQEKLFAALKVINIPTRSTYQQAVTEIEDLLGSVHNMLNFFVSRVTWKEKKSDDIIEAISSMARFSDPTNFLLEEQGLVIKNWLDPQNDRISN